MRNANNFFVAVGSGMRGAVALLHRASVRRWQRLVGLLVLRARGAWEAP